MVKYILTAITTFFITSAFYVWLITHVVVVQAQGCANKYGDNLDNFKGCILTNYNIIKDSVKLEEVQPETTKQ